MRTCIAAIAVAACWMPAEGGQTARAGSSTVYVYTARAPNGVVTEEEQGRLDSVRDMRDALRGGKKLVLVSDANEAAVVVEVLSRETREASMGGFGGKVITPPVDMMIRLRVKCGAEQTEIKGASQGYWGRAAKDGAQRVVKWMARACQSPSPA